MSTEKGAVQGPSKTRASVSTHDVQAKSALPMLADGVQPRRNPPRRARQKTANRCALCEMPDNDRMVQCDECELWCHFNCVQVGESIAEVSWFCPGCANVTPSETLNKNICSVRSDSQQQLNPPPMTELRTSQLVDRAGEARQREKSSCSFKSWRRKGNYSSSIWSRSTVCWKNWRANVRR